METENPTASNDEKLLQFFKALSDEDRLKIAGVLAIKPSTLQELSVETGIGYRELVRHLQHLEDAGLIHQRVNDDVSRYSLRLSSLQEMKSEILARPSQATPGSFNTLEDDEQAVLNAFLRDGKLIALPAQQHRREIVFRWLVDQFEYDWPYPEKEINVTLEQFHPDFALLRRELVDRGYMTRDHGIYIRTPQEST